MNPVGVGTVVHQRFELLEELGVGSSAEVYRARDQATGAMVALKRFGRSTVSAADFRREAAITMRVRHPALARLVDAGVSDARPWLAIEYFDGGSLREWLQHHAAAGEQTRLVTGFARSIFEGLDALHRAGLAHGDVKPDNVLLHDERPRLVDFGRARLHHLLGAGGGVYAGSPGYMHPSLFRGAAPSAATDCFAAWVTIYELACGARPYSVTVLQGGRVADLAVAPPLGDPDLWRVVLAGLTGRLGDARSSWLALSAFKMGLSVIPIERAPVHPPAPAVVLASIDHARGGRSVAISGDADHTRLVLEAIDRAWRRTGGRVLWARTRQDRSQEPLDAALSAVADAPEGLSDDSLLDLAISIGPLAGVLRSALPSVRAWLEGADEDVNPARLELAVGRFLASCPRPMLLLAEGFDRFDGASRRLFHRLIGSGVLTVVGSVLPGASHGLPNVIASDETSGPMLYPGADQSLDPQDARIVAMARLLQLPFGPLLAVAGGLDIHDVARAGIVAECLGLARWTGSEVVARRGPPPDAEDATRWRRAAGRNLDALSEPLRVATYARLGDDPERLGEVIDAAIEHAARLDPLVALDIAVGDPRPDTVPRLLQRFSLALQARDISRSEALLERLRAHPDATRADLKEAEGELSHRRGNVVEATVALADAAAALGAPVPTGLRGLWRDLVAVWQIRRGKLPVAAPHPQLGRIFEHLYDLHFSSNQGPLLRIHRLWMAAAPQSPRAQAIEVLWLQMLDRPALATALEARLLEQMRVGSDPIGAAVVRLHGGIARLLRGDVMGAFAEGVDATELLMQVGDPYQAALASTLPALCAVHIGGVDTQISLQRRLAELVGITGDRRAATWGIGLHAVTRWAIGQRAEAIDVTSRWARHAHQQHDMSEAVAWRLRAEMLLEERRASEAVDALVRCDEVCSRYKLRMDFTDARAISWLVAIAQLGPQAGGLRGRGRQARRQVRWLARIAPRWQPRIRMAGAWAHLAAGERDLARLGFDAALADAIRREQVHDAWLILHHQGLALDDERAHEEARGLARHHGLKQGLPASAGWRSWSQPLSPVQDDDAPAD